jgi:hypothetical protein
MLKPDFYTLALALRAVLHHPLVAALVLVEAPLISASIVVIALQLALRGERA